MKATGHQTTAAGHRGFGFCPDSWKAQLDGVIDSGEESGLESLWLFQFFTPS